ncbi:hypothetical protein KUTG_08143 [Kutzneria sp. 744]|nr:hypothetical protein KUTG_08143 [Kutzneria sp. 744]
MIKWRKNGDGNPAERVGSGRNEKLDVPLTCGDGDCRRSAERRYNLDTVGALDASWLALFYGTGPGQSRFGDYLAYTSTQVEAHAGAEHQSHQEQLGVFNGESLHLDGTAG